MGRDIILKQSLSKRLEGFGPPFPLPMNREDFAGESTALMARWVEEGRGRDIHGMLYEHWFARFEDMAGDAPEPEHYPFPDTQILQAICEECEAAFCDMAPGSLA